MEAKTKKLIIISGIIIALVAVYYFFFRKKDETVTPSETKTDSGKKDIIPANGTKAANLPEASFPLKQGSKGRQVLYIQAAMNVNNGANLVLDGDWGPATTNAVLKYYPTFGGSVSWANYRKIYSAYSQIINGYLKEKGLA